MQNSILREDADYFLAIDAAWLSKPPHFQHNTMTSKMSHFGGLFWGFSQNNNQPIVSPQHNTEEQRFKKLGQSWKLFQNPPPPPSGGMFHWPVIFIVAVQNETVGSSGLKQSLYGGKNQYSNIRARLIRGSLLLRGHWGATAFKWGIQLWNIVWDELWWVSD